MFRVGMKVVCVDDTDCNSHGIPELAAGAIYTIRWVGMFEGESCVRLDEVLRDTAPHGYYLHPSLIDWPWAARRFRPVVERKTSIEIFQKMLTPKQQEIVGADRG